MSKIRVTKSLKRALKCLRKAMRPKHAKEIEKDIAFDLEQSLLGMHLLDEVKSRKKLSPEEISTAEALADELDTIPVSIPANAFDHVSQG